MVNPYLPEDVVLTINGSNVSFDVTDYKETGGQRAITFTKTLHRHQKNVRSIPSDWVVSFSGTTTNTTFGSLYLMDTPMSIAVTWSGSLTVTYTNAQSSSYNLSMSAADRLIFTAEFSVPYYNSVGSANRSVV